MPELLERRVDKLEDLTEELRRAALRTERQFERTDRQIEKTERIVAALGLSQDALNVRIDALCARMDQDSADKAEEQAARAEERAARAEEQAARAEERAARAEERAARAEDRAANERDRIARRKEWGELSRRLGTMAEDLVAPSIPRILRTVIGCPDNHVDAYMVRVRKWSAQLKREREFDVVATCGDYLLLNETKSQLTPSDVKKFVALLPTVREHYFPEHPGKRVIGALASLYVDASLVRHGERQGLIILGFGEDLMDVLNSPGFVPREF